MFSFIHTYIVSKSPGGEFYAFSFTPSPPDPEKAGIAAAFSAPLSFGRLFCPTLPAVRSERQPQFFSLLRRRHLFLPFRCPSSPLLPKLGALLPGKREDSPSAMLHPKSLPPTRLVCRFTGRNIIYLTFDCGYENGNTPTILDALQKHQAPATFFVVGNFLSDQPDLCQTYGSGRPYRRKPHLVAPGYVQNLHAGSLLRRTEPSLHTLSGNHRPGNGEILPAAAGKIQHTEPADGKGPRIPDVFLESRLCRLVTEISSDPRGGFQKS